MLLVFIFSLFIRCSASVQSQTSQPLRWVKRRKWAFGPGSAVYKELVRFQQRFDVSSTQETVCHPAKAQHRSTDSLTHIPPIHLGREKQEGWRGRGLGVCRLMVPPSEYLFPPLIMLACLLLQPFFIPPQMKAWKTKLNLSNRSGDKRHPGMVVLRSSNPCLLPGLHFQRSPHFKLGHSVIVLCVRANP